MYCGKARNEKRWCEILLREVRIAVLCTLAERRRVREEVRAFVEALDR